MKKLLKETHELTEEIIETAGRTASDDGKIAEHSKILGDGFEKFSKICENILKPLELVTSTITLGVSIYKSLKIRHNPDPKMTVGMRASKQHKRDTMAFFALGGLGFAIAAFFTAGVGALALLGGGYVVSTFKAAYRQNRYNDKATTLKKDRRAIAMDVNTMLDNPAPKPQDVKNLSHRVAEFLAIDKKHEKQIDKRKETRFDLGVCATSAVLLIAAAIFPPITAPLVGLALVSIAVGAASKLKSWASEKFPKIFKSKAAQTHKAHETKYQRLDEMLDHITPSNAPNRDKRVSFVHRIEKMMDKIESPKKTQSAQSNPQEAPLQREEAEPEITAPKPEPIKKEKAQLNVYHTDLDLFQDLEILDHRKEDHPRFEQYQKVDFDDMESPV